MYSSLEDNQIKEASPIYLITVLYCLIALYVIPYNTFPHAKIFLPLIGLMLFIYSLMKNERYSLENLYFVLMLIIVSVLNFSSELMIETMVLIITILILKDVKQYYLSRFYTNIIYFISLLFIIIQLCIYRFDQRIVLSVIDPNVSGLLMLLFFFFSNKNKYKLGIFLSITCVFLFLSRNYLIAIIVFYLVRYTKEFLNPVYKKLNNFLILLSITTIIIVILSYYWTNKYNLAYLQNDNSLTRLIHFNDSSNTIRFWANRYLIETLSQSFEKTLFGLDDQYLKLFTNNVGVGIHNSVLIIVAKFGLLYSIIYFYIISKIIDKYFVFRNYEYIFSYLLFGNFLHGAYSGVPLLFFIFILSMMEYDKSNIKKFENLSIMSNDKM